MSDNDAPPKRPRRLRWDVILSLLALNVLGLTVLGVVWSRLFPEPIIFRRSIHADPNLRDRVGLEVWDAMPWLGPVGLVLLIAAIVVRLRTRER